MYEPLVPDLAFHRRVVELPPPAGTGWWEEGVVLAEDAQEPVPWPEAAQRLVEAGFQKVDRVMRPVH